MGCTLSPKICKSSGRLHPFTYILNQKSDIQKTFRRPLGGRCFQPAPSPPLVPLYSPEVSPQWACKTTPYIL